MISPFIALARFDLCFLASLEPFSIHLFELSLTTPLHLRTYIKEDTCSDGDAFVDDVK